MQTIEVHRILERKLEKFPYHLKKCRDQGNFLEVVNGIYTQIPPRQQQRLIPYKPWPETFN